MNLLAQFLPALEFAVCYALFALSTYAALSTGILSLASAAFGAVSGFLSVYLLLEFFWPFWLVVVVGALVGAAMGLLVSLPILRLGTHYLALATLALVLVTRVFVLNLSEVTGGAAGVAVPRVVQTWELFAILGVIAWVLARMRRSRFGLAAEAVREDEQVAASLGTSVLGIRRKAMALSGALAGIGGVLLANVLGYIGPDTYYIHLSFTMLAAVVLGGAYHWAGGVVGALVFTLLPEALRQYVDHGETIANGVILVLIMLFLPRGIVDPTRLVKRRSKKAAARAETGPAPDDVALVEAGTPRNEVVGEGR